MIKTYFKVYQDKTCTGFNDLYYIAEIEEEIKNFASYFDMLAQGDIEYLPVFEPVEMEEEEFQKIPEFQGF